MKMNRFQSGFTLAELTISIAILSMILAMSTWVYFSFFGSVRNIRAANNIYEEARFTIERLAQEIRSNAIDYEEYYNKNPHKDPLKGGDKPSSSGYGQNYCKYNQQFYKAGPDGILGTDDDDSAGSSADTAALNYDNAATPDFLTELYLINVDGDTKTLIKRIEVDNPLAPSLGKIGRLAILKLEGKDYGADHLPSGNGTPADVGENDNVVDTWKCPAGIVCIDEKGGVSTEGFTPITPETIDIKTIQFLITPQDDPYKAYNAPAMQVQPRVTMKLYAAANPALANEFKGNPPDITLSTTVGSRILQGVLARCPVKECEDSAAPSACPLKEGVCSAATRQCINGRWTDCSYASLPDFMAQEGSPKCSDTLDNDCNGLKDDQDPTCIYELCNDNTKNGDESCKDVGGRCSFLRPLQTKETLCGDLYDNDCDGSLDAIDPDCL